MGEKVPRLEHTQATVGANPIDGDMNKADMLVWLVILFWRENEGCPAGFLPRAFSDIPRICELVSSVVDAMDGLREV